MSQNQCFRASWILGAVGIAILMVSTLVVPVTRAYAQGENSAGCTGSCIFSNGSCGNVDCGGTGCACSGDNKTCACHK